jgi:hypothetical protein
MAFKDMDILKEHLSQLDPTWNSIFRLVRVREYLYLRCRRRNCPARISLGLKDRLYQVVKFSNWHEHNLREDKTRQFKEIAAFLERIHLGIGDVDAKQVLMKTFGIS